MTMLSEHPHEYMNESGWVNIVNNSVCNSRIEVEIDREKKTKHKNYSRKKKMYMQDRRTEEVSTYENPRKKWKENRGAH